MAQALGAALAQQVDLHGGVDGDEVVVQPRQRRVVGEVHRVHLQPRVAVHETVQLVRSQREGRDRLARQVVLAAVGDRAAFHQREDAVADHLGVDAQVALARELHHHRVGNAAVADLQGGAVVDQVGHVPADGLLHGADFRQADFHHRLAALDQRRHLRDVHVAVAVRIGHVGVHLEHDRARLRHGGHRVVGAQAQREVAVRVHRRGHAEHHVGRDLPALDLRRDLGEIVRNEVDPACLPARARGTAEEQRDVAHVLDRLGVDVGVLAHRQDLRHLHVAEVAALLRQRREQRGRLADARGHDDHVAVAHLAHGIGGGNALLRVQGLGSHACHYAFFSPPPNSRCTQSRSTAVAGRLAARGL
ncbi:hypothetical protein D9M68_634900 [compost metagenome]